MLTDSTIKNPKWITAEINGGLGNQLYQIFHAIAFSLKMNRPFYFKYMDRILGHASVRGTYWAIDSLLCALAPNVLYDPVENARRDQSRLVIHESGHHYTPIGIPDPADDFPEVICLAGYFQSYKYFEKEFDQICEITGISACREKFRAECTKRGFPIANISMHFRLGDYQQLQDIHPIMPMIYYRNALRFLVDHIKTKEPTSKKITVLYFCEAADNNYVLENYMKQLIELFPECDFTLADQRLSDWKQMLYMSLCDHHIIGNSTFSLWGAQLNPSPTKQVCYPWKWFTEAFVRRDRRFVHDMFPPTWKKIAWLYYSPQFRNYSY